MLAISYAVRGLYSETHQTNYNNLTIFSSKSTLNAELGGEIGGVYHIQKNIIYFNVDGGYNYATKQRSIEHKEYTDQMLKGFLIHEMHHAWENFKHQNNCDPYAATSDKSQMKDLMEEANKANRTVSLNSTNPITLPSGIFNIFHYPENNTIWNWS